MTIETKNKIAAEVLAGVEVEISYQIIDPQFGTRELHTETLELGESFMLPEGAVMVDVYFRKKGPLL